MQVFDTSAIVYAWDNYPIDQFPPLWNWLAKEVGEGRVCMPEVALTEVESVSPDCATWLTDQGITCLPMKDEILLSALQFKNFLEIGAHFGGGVGENDLLIIATAKHHGVQLISNEAFQPTLPKTKANYKMPAVCALPGVSVACHDFLEFLKKSKAVFA